MSRKHHSKHRSVALTVFFVLMLLFAVATLVGGFLVIRLHYNTAYSLFPALLTLVFWIICKRIRKKIEKSEE